MSGALGAGAGTGACAGFSGAAGPAGASSGRAAVTVHGFAGRSPKPDQPCLAAHGLANTLGMPKDWS
jgi:hypothetical protein